eukprot:8460433-Alexandrium_andersonii.AAC.1
MAPRGLPTARRPGAVGSAVPARVGAGERAKLPLVLPCDSWLGAASCLRAVSTGLGRPCRGGEDRRSERTEVAYGGPGGPHERVCGLAAH